MEVISTNTFRKQVNKLEKSEREKLLKKIENVLDGNIRGKHLKHNRKGTRELRLGSKRLYFKIDGEVLYLLEYSHKDKQ